MVEQQTNPADSELRSRELVAEHSFLELIVEKSNTWSEIAATCSLTSPELEGIMDLAREELDSIAPVLAVDHSSGVPVSPIVKYPFMRGLLEINQAVVYSMLINLQGLDGLCEERNELLHRAETRLANFRSPFASVILNVCKGVIEYHNGVAGVFKGKTRRIIEYHLDKAIKHLETARKQAHNYMPVYEFLAVFNLGRAYMTRGIPVAAEWYFKASERFTLPQIALSRYYRSRCTVSQGDFGIVIPDQETTTYQLREILTLQATDYIFPFGHLIGLFGSDGRKALTDITKHALSSIFAGYDRRRNQTPPLDWRESGWTYDFETAKPNAIAQGLRLLTRTE